MTGFLVGATAFLKIVSLQDRTSQAIIENLRSSLVKSEYHQSKRWKEEQNERPQATKSGVSIYVYDLPRFNTDFYNAHKLEYTKKCRNQIGERELHQRFLDSPNRVLDGELADLYYVPVYTGCYRTVIGTELLTDAYAATYKCGTCAHVANDGLSSFCPDLTLLPRVGRCKQVHHRRYRCDQKGLPILGTQSGYFASQFPPSIHILYIHIYRFSTLQPSVDDARWLFSRSRSRVGFSVRLRCLS